MTRKKPLKQQHAVNQHDAKREQDREQDKTRQQGDANQPPTAPLGQFASARSGDKGNHANVGVVARSAVDFAFLRRELTAARVAEFFDGLGATRVERYELPEVWALNFLLYNALRGGASESLFIDTQGKLLGTAILDLELTVPAASEKDPAEDLVEQPTEQPGITPALWIRKNADGTVD